MTKKIPRDNVSGDWVTLFLPARLKGGGLSGAAFFVVGLLDRKSVV